MSKSEGFLIIEGTSSNSLPNILEDQNRSIVFEAELQEAEVSNRNNRVYDRQSLWEALNSSMVKEKIDRKTFYGEAGHPLTDDIKRQTYIDQTRISHIVNKVDFRGNKIFGIVETANTQCGSDMRGLIRQGSEVSFSMRGMGSVYKKEGSTTRITGNLMIISYDWVVFPSHPNSYMTRKLSESMDINNDQIDKVITEGKIIKFDMKDLYSYIVESSNQVKCLSESLNINISKDLKNVNLENNDVLSIQEGNKTLKVFLEESIKRDINDYIKNF